MTATADITVTDAIGGATGFAELEVVALAAARRIARADGATLVLRDGENCFYAAEDTMAPLWKGQRFPLVQCISGWAMLTCTQAVVTDIETDSRIPVEAYRPTFVRSVVMTPMGTDDPPGAIGVYWSAAGHTLSEAERSALATLAAEVGTAVRRLGVDKAPWAPNFAVRCTEAARYA